MFSFTAFFSMFRKKFKKGFSLYEILIVVAIIGILAGIILVVMNPAREQAKRARISVDLVQLQNQAEIFYLDDGNYNNLNCTTGAPEIIAFCDDVEEQGSSVVIKSPSPNYTYCAYSYFPSSAQGFCVDSTGFSDKLYFPGLSCDSSTPFCEYRDCPDFNINGVVECSNDPDPSEAFNCPNPPDATGVPGSDVYCIWACDQLSSSNLPVECGVDPCFPFGGAGDPSRCGGNNETCLDMYDINKDGSVNLSTDILSLLLLIGTICE